MIRYRDTHTFIIIYSRFIVWFFRHIVNVVQGVTLFGVSTVSILLSAQLLDSILSTTLPEMGLCSWLLVCGVALIPLSWLSSPKEFW